MIGEWRFHRHDLFGCSIGQGCGQRDAVTPRRQSALVFKETFSSGAWSKTQSTILTWRPPARLRRSRDGDDAGFSSP
jgi:hypothetical protein